MLGFNGGLMGVRRTPTGSAASGLWFQNEQSVARRAAIWPTTEDPNWNDVSLLLHMDGSNGSTTFTDSSSNALTVTPLGNAQISTAQSKWGGSSALLDGTGDYISCGPNAFSPGSSDFTIEWWQKLASTGVAYSSIATGSNSGIRASDGLIQIYYNGGVPGSTNVAASTSAVSNTNWNHIAISRQGSTVRIFINGSLLFNDAADSVNGFSGGSFDIGRSTDIYTAFNGYIDDLRVTVGIARYTSNFTPPTAPFPNG